MTLVLVLESIEVWAWALEIWAWALGSQARALGTRAWSWLEPALAFVELDLGTKDSGLVVEDRA